MTAVGCPLGSPNWWERCTWPDGSPVHILTFKEFEDKEALEEMAQALMKRFKETLNELLVS
jgi:hypothetical protein